MSKYIKYRHVHIVVVVSTIFYFWTRFWRFSSGFICPVFGYDTFSDTGLYTILAISFITALVLGIANIRLKWLYPTYVSAFIWLVSAFMYVQLNRRIDSYFFMYYMLYSFFIIFLGQQILASLGLGVGILVRKICTRLITDEIA